MQPSKELSASISGIMHQQVQMGVDSQFTWLAQSTTPRISQLIQAMMPLRSTLMETEVAKTMQ